MTRSERIERAAHAIVQAAAIQPGGYRFGWPTWQLADVELQRLRAALAETDDELRDRTSATPSQSQSLLGLG